MTEHKQTKGPARRNERLSAALRENLKRRKQQARGRAAAAERPKSASPRHPKADDRGPER